jgi:hypothetical protein
VFGTNQQMLCSFVFALGAAVLVAVVALEETTLAPVVVLLAVVEQGLVYIFLLIF